MVSSSSASSLTFDIGGAEMIVTDRPSVTKIEIVASRLDRPPRATSAVLPRPHPLRHGPSPLMYRNRSRYLPKPGQDRPPLLRRVRFCRRRLPGVRRYW